MIYQVELPELTLRRLTDVVYLQMWFLRYASSRPTLDKESCEDYFYRHPKFRGRHQQIAKWLWKTKRLGQKSKTKLELLEEFAQGPSPEKRKWSRLSSHEALAFLKNPVNSIMLQPHSNTAPFWQNAGAEFLRQFYDYLGVSTTKFPEYFFSEPGAQKFGREEFLTEFKQANRIFLCPACDTERYTRIDHYFPKSLYPHLACHPYNLVPICNTCNTDYKGETNILTRKESSNQRKLEDVFLPYRGYGIGTDAYLEVSLKKGIRSPIIIGFKPQQGKELRERIEVCRDAFSIPDRWQKQITEIESLVYSQIQQATQAQVDLSPTQRGDLDIFGVRNLLDSLLYDLFNKQGTEALRFPMTWCLAALINQEIEPAIHNSTQISLENYPLLKEIASWLKQDTITHPAHVSSDRLDKARSLRRIAKGGA